jgi:hypothetical protein
MVTNRKPLAQPPRHRLGHAEVSSLLYGGPEDGAFATDDDRHAAWKRHRDTLLAWKAAGKRPLAWWQYDAPPAVQDQLGNFDWEEEILWVNNLLRPDEKAELEHDWRQGFEAAWQPGFTHRHQIDGEAYWFEGRPARDLYWRWLRIPGPLLRHWKAQRRRRRWRRAWVDRSQSAA